MRDVKTATLAAGIHLVHIGTLGPVLDAQQTGTKVLSLKMEHPFLYVTAAAPAGKPIEAVIPLSYVSHMVMK